MSISILKNIVLKLIQLLIIDVLKSFNRILIQLIDINIKMKKKSFFFSIFIDKLCLLCITLCHRIPVKSAAKTR